jgi:flagellar protein FlgJ
MWQVNGTTAAPAGFEDVALPLSANDGASVDFSRVFASTQQDIAATIEQGFADDGAPALSTAAQALRQRLGLTAPTAQAAGSDELQLGQSQQDFLQSIAPLAKQAGSALGVAPELVAAHAALESGWGQRPLKAAGGADSHNLFGIKAGSNWQGAVSEALTTEHVNGADVKTTQRFRAYPDLPSAFADYAQLLQNNPRFAGALGRGSDANAFAQALAHGGYATDPAYASKLARVAAQLKGL